VWLTQQLRASRRLVSQRAGSSTKGVLALAQVLSQTKANNGTEEKQKL